MSLQTNVFENGRWVTRSIDPYQMRARNMDKEKNAMSRPNPAKAPSLGLLTKTLVRSSVTKWILPVRVRHQSKNDVLFIAADRVDIKEALGNSTLKNIGVKADFDSPIKSARIIGDLRELTRDNKLSQFWTDQEDIAVNAHSTSKRTLPPHIAVLGLESHKLVFLCATNGTSEEPEWLSWHKELPGAASPLEKLGEHIAVDPKSVIHRYQASITR